MVNAVNANELIERKRNSERSGLARFLLCDRQAVTLPVLYDVTEPEVDHIRNADAEIRFQRECKRYPLVRPAPREACFDGVYDFSVLLRS